MEKIGYLGPEGSYSKIAAERMRPDAELRAYPSFPEVFSSLVSGETEGVVVPIENTLNGGVLQNMDLLQSTENVAAVKECIIQIEHRLALLSGAKLSQIKRVYSHPQALEQCARYLRENLPSANLIPTRSTAASLEKILTNEDAGIVGAHVKAAGIKLSAENISDEDNNFTHFLLVKRGGISVAERTRKIYFSATCLNKPGALLSLLSRISNRGLNLTKLQSRPIKNIPDEYRFFIETEGDYSDENIRLALKDVKAAAKSFKLLGAY